LKEIVWMIARYQYQVLHIRKVQELKQAQIDSKDSKICWNNKREVYLDKIVQARNLLNLKTKIAIKSYHKKVQDKQYKF